MSLEIRRLVLVLFIFVRWSEASKGRLTSCEPNCPMRLKDLGVDVKFLQDNCKCEDSTCRCCFEGSWPQWNISQEFCMQSAFHWEDLELRVDASLNGNEVGNFILSGRNPPPICFPVPFPIPIPLSVCMRAKDIYIREGRGHVCVDTSLRFAGFDFLTLHVGCFWMGIGGIEVANQKSYKKFNKKPNQVKRINKGLSIY